MGLREIDCRRRRNIVVRVRDSRSWEIDYLRRNHIMATVRDSVVWRPKNQLTGRAEDMNRAYTYSCLRYCS